MVSLLIWIVQCFEHIAKMAKFWWNAKSIIRTFCQFCGIYHNVRYWYHDSEWNDVINFVLLFGCTVIDHKPLIANKHTNSYMYMYLQRTSVCFFNHLFFIWPTVCTSKMKTYFSWGKIYNINILCFCLKHLVIDSDSKSYT